MGRHIEYEAITDWTTSVEGWGTTHSVEIVFDDVVVLVFPVSFYPF